MSHPNVVVLGGPNGSGKSTAAVRLLHDTLQIMEFVNADAIAKGLSAFRPEGVAVEAGRIMLNHLKGLAARGESFAFETTLASRSFAPWIQSLRKDHGYRFRLVYVWLRSPDLNVIRVAARVASGGHDVPVETIHRRYLRSVCNLFELYLPLADSWEVFDNSLYGNFTLVASGVAGCETSVAQPQIWSMMRTIYGTAGNERTDRGSLPRPADH